MLWVSSDVIFVGSFLHAPNIEGMNWFVRNIMPILVKAKPNIIVTVVVKGLENFLIRMKKISVFWDTLRI